MGNTLKKELRRTPSLLLTQVRMPHIMWLTPLPSSVPAVSVVVRTRLPDSSLSLPVDDALNIAILIAFACLLVLLMAKLSGNRAKLPFYLRLFPSVAEMALIEMSLDKPVAPR